MALKKRLKVITGDGKTYIVEVSPKTTPRSVQNSLKMPPINISLDSVGRVVAPDEDLYELMEDEDVARIEPDASWA